MQSTDQLLTASSAFPAQCNPITVPLFVPCGSPEYLLTLHYGKKNFMSTNTSMNSANETYPSVLSSWKADKEICQSS